mmetsp:Transcript_45726/g.114433  ORF Transcript_45726/g.114433 Transcript_45726/m.114433 type:complete len:218 (-) Transcript_45726:1377-2030(-)
MTLPMFRLPMALVSLSQRVKATPRREVTTALLSRKARASLSRMRRVITAPLSLRVRRSPSLRRGLTTTLPSQSLRGIPSPSLKRMVTMENLSQRLKRSLRARANPQQRVPPAMPSRLPSLPPPAMPPAVASWRCQPCNQRQQQPSTLAPGGCCGAAWRRPRPSLNPRQSLSLKPSPGPSLRESQKASLGPVQILRCLGTCLQMVSAALRSRPLAHMP